ncbi:MAG: nicotinamidase [Candidatus Omnitrophica bacterium]|nr:nicotinamidase [Candidatus Omnitrophota bacterium]MBU1925653.1 nicotinamidase [Candidatus Omnitrophota bacterium]
MKTYKALLIIDVQNDFCPGGALAVTDAGKIIPILNRYIRLFSKDKLAVFASRDWHKKITRHFEQFGGAWPAHCIQNTKGARFHRALKLAKNTIIVSKGMNPKKDNYSAFQAENSRGVKLERLLRILRITDLYVGGLATDYCVKSSVMDALKKRFRVWLLMDAIMGVNLKTGDSKKAISEMMCAGAKKTAFSRLKKQFGQKR